MIIVNHKPSDKNKRTLITNISHHCKTPHHDLEHLCFINEETGTTRWNAFTVYPGWLLMHLKLEPDLHTFC